MLGSTLDLLFRGIHEASLFLDLPSPMLERIGTSVDGVLSLLQVSLPTPHDRIFPNLTRLGDGRASARLFGFGFSLSSRINDPL